MAAKYMKIQKIVIPFITLLILVSQLTGCSPLTSKEALEEIDNGSDVVIEYSIPDDTQVNEDETKNNDVIVSNTSVIIDGKEYSIDKTKFDEAEFLGYCETAYDKVWRNPDIHMRSEDHLDTELSWLKFLVESENGNTYTVNEAIVYENWRRQEHPNPEILFDFEPCNSDIIIDLNATVYDKPCKYHGRILGTIQAGTILKNVKLSSEAIWVELEYEGQTAYILGQDAYEYEGSSENQTVDTEESEDELFKSVNETVYATEKVNIRESYSAASTKLGQLTRGQSVTRIGVGQGEASDWSQVRLSDGRTAYINSKYLSTTKPTTQPSNSKPANNTGSSGGNSGGSSNTNTGGNSNSSGSQHGPSIPANLDAGVTGGEDLSNSNDSSGGGIYTGPGVIG